MDVVTASCEGAQLPLSNDTLAAHGRGFEVPTYDRRAVTPGIVHFGVGGFHRAHQAVYLDELAQRGLSDEWGVIGVSMRHATARDALQPQDWLYTLVERDGSRDRARVIGILDRVLFAPDDPAAVVAALAAPTTRIVSLTVTGNAYEPQDDGDGEAAGPDAFGLIVAALAQRRRAGLPPFTVMSCDNVPDNGRVARAAVLRAAEGDPDLARWINVRGAFPSSVVDRITPKSTPETRELVRDSFGVDDRWPVVAEPFTQWILEDDFCAGRPPLEEVGVELVDDVAAHQRTKKRLLNGGHSALGYVGLLAGYETTDEAMADDAVRSYLSSLMAEEIAPLLGDAGGIDLDRYRETLLERFSNPGVGDQLSRLCERGSTKLPAYLLPSVEEALAEGAPIDRLSLAVAAWMRSLRGRDSAGRRIPVVDPRRDLLVSIARHAGDDPRPLLSRRDIFGDLIEHDEFVHAVERHLRALGDGGVAAALERDPMSLAA